MIRSISPCLRNWAGEESLQTGEEILPGLLSGAAETLQAPPDWDSQLQMGWFIPHLGLGGMSRESNYFSPSLHLK